MRKSAFALLELMIVVIIVGILASLAMPMFQGATIKAKMAELYTTVTTIEKAEEIYYLEHGSYATMLTYYLNSNNQSGINNFRDILGVDVPGLNAVFTYAVPGSPARINVSVREHPEWTPLCMKYIEAGDGYEKGEWCVYPLNPWVKYLNLP